MTMQSISVHVNMCAFLLNYDTFINIRTLR